MKKLYVLLIVLTFSSIMFGCNQNETNSQDANDNVNVEQSSYRSDEMMSREQIASHLATIASEVNDVNDAVAVVAGPYAVVGIDIDKEVERQETGTIKYTVLEALEHDPYGRQAVVVADADMMERLRQMKTDIQNGAPIEGVADELGNIVGRYMPTFPVPHQQQQPEDIIEGDDQPNPAH